MKLKFFGLIISFFAFFSYSSAQVDISKQDESLIKFMESEVFKNQFSYTQYFINLVQENNLESFIKEGKFDKKWKIENEEFIEQYDSIRYHLNNCNLNDTSIFFTYDFIKGENIRETHIVFKFDCSENIKKYLDYHAELIFYNKEDGELIAVETKFRKFYLNPDSLPDFPSLND